MEDYPCACIEDKIDNTDITILGVQHVEPFLLQHYSFLQSQINKADAVVLEQVVGGSSVTDSFFGHLAMIAIPKPVYVVDPINTALFFTDRVLGFLGLCIMLTSPMRYATRFVAKKVFKGKESKKAPTRREFLGSLFKSAAIFGAGTSLFSGSLSSLSLKDAISPNMVLNYGVEDVLSYGSIDFRNIIIAEGLNKIITTQKEKKILTIHGDAHSKPIHYYLTHPAFRAKKLAYLPFALICRNEIKKYQFMGFDWRMEATLPF